MGTSKVLNPELKRSPYSENERHVIDGKIIDVSYHLIDWFKCFHPDISEQTFKNAVYGFFFFSYKGCSILEATKVVRTMSTKQILYFAEYYQNAVKYRESLRAAFVAGRL